MDIDVEHSTEAVETTSKALSSIGDAYAGMENKAFLKIAAGQPLSMFDKNYDKLGAFSKFAKYAGPAAIGLDVATSLLGIPTNEEKMMEMIEALAAQVTEVHQDLKNRLAEYDKKDEFRAALGRISEDVARIQGYQAAVARYWEKEQKQFDEIAKTPESGRKAMAPELYSEMQVANNTLKESISVNDLDTSIGAIRDEVTRPGDQNILKAVYDLSKGDLGQVTEWGLKLMKLVATAPSIEGTYWRAHCAAMSGIDATRAVESMHTVMVVEHQNDITDKYVTKGVVSEVENAVKAWIQKAASWQSMTDHFKEKLDDIVDDLKKDPNVPWPAETTTDWSEAWQAFHQYLAFTITDRLCDAYPFEWVVTVNDGNENSRGETHCGFSLYVMHDLDSIDLESTKNGSCAAKRTDIRICGIDPQNAKDMYYWPREKWGELPKKYDAFTDIIGGRIESGSAPLHNPIVGGLPSDLKASIIMGKTSKEEFPKSGYYISWGMSGNNPAWASSAVSLIARGPTFGGLLMLFPGRVSYADYQSMNPTNAYVMNVKTLDFG